MDLEPEERISLSLTSTYAPTWGLWEGVRELVQNWNDGMLNSTVQTDQQRTASLAYRTVSTHRVEARLRYTPSNRSSGQPEYSSVVGWCEYLPDDHKLVWVNHSVSLLRKILLMGYSKKAAHQDVIGSFGEGLKVGAIALLRRGCTLKMLTDREVWQFGLEADAAFGGEKVLTVSVAKRRCHTAASEQSGEEAQLKKQSGTPSATEVDDDDAADDASGLPTCRRDIDSSDTVTILEGLKPAEWMQFSKRFLFLNPPKELVPTEVGNLLLDPQLAGQLYVRGVWINSDPEIAAGVDLFDISLDRDRAAVLKKSELQHKVSSMWVRAIHRNPSLKARYYELLASGNQTMDTVLSDLYCDDDVAQALAEIFRAQHGDALPMTVKDTNSAKAAQVRNRLSVATVVCSEALLNVLKKGGVACDLDTLLEESALKSRRYVPLADLTEGEMRVLVEVCHLVQKMLKDPISLLERIDVYIDETESLPSKDPYCRLHGDLSSSGRCEINRRAFAMDGLRALEGDSAFQRSFDRFISQGSQPPTTAEATTIATTAAAATRTSSTSSSSSSSTAAQSSPSGLATAAATATTTATSTSLAAACTPPLTNNPPNLLNSSTSNNNKSSNNNHSSNNNNNNNSSSNNSNIHNTNNNNNNNNFLVGHLSTALFAALGGEMRFGLEKLAFIVASEDQQKNNPVLKCPELGRLREEALLQRNNDVELERATDQRAHADELQRLMKRVEEAEKELRLAEFKYVDSSTAEAELRGRYQAEVDRLSAIVASLQGAKEEADNATAALLEKSKQVTRLQRLNDELEAKLNEVEAAATRRSEAADRTLATLRRGTVARWQQLQGALARVDSGGGEGSVHASVVAVLNEVRTALQEEIRANCCVICTVNTINAVVLPCRHQHLCVDCAAPLSTCPLCRGPVEKILQVYT